MAGVERTCNRCNTPYQPEQGRCPRCGCPEFRIPRSALSVAERKWMEKHCPKPMEKVNVV